MKRPIRFRLNGRPAVLDTEDERTLLWVLRAVIANAVFDLTGVRLYQLPMNSRRVREALTK
ncbi:MAG TPA: hypothetical protein VEU30_13645 [Thermoanaerobaculia bacterium]|nr:hypothetical protein [Thermoanaerobaculia bacterium]